MGSLRLIIGIYGTAFAVAACVAPKLAKLVMDDRLERLNAIEESFKCRDCGARFCEHQLEQRRLAKNSPLLGLFYGSR